MEIKHFYAADDFTGEQCVLLSDHVASHAYVEAKERELFELEFEKPLSANFAGDEYRYMGQVGRPEMVLFIEFVGSWEGWKKCAQSRARSA